MELQQVMDELRTLKHGYFPAEAVREAATKREEITPLLLAELERVADDPTLLADGKYMRPMYALYLLAQFREPRAWPVILRLFGQATEENHLVDNTGDFVTEKLAVVLACVYNGDLVPLKKIITDRHCDQWVRGACIRALVHITMLEWHPLAETKACISKLLAGELERNNSNNNGDAWTSLAGAVRDLRMNNLAAVVLKAYDDGLIDPSFMSPQKFHSMCSSSATTIETTDDCRCRLITDAVAEMRHWPCFTKPCRKAKTDETSAKKTVSSSVPTVMTLVAMTPSPATRPRSATTIPAPAAAVRNTRNAAAVYKRLTNHVN